MGQQNVFINLSLLTLHFKTNFRCYRNIILDMLETSNNFPGLLATQIKLFSQQPFFLFVCIPLQRKKFVLKCHWDRNLNFTLRVAEKSVFSFCWPFFCCVITLFTGKTPSQEASKWKWDPKALLANFLNDSLNLLWLTHTLLIFTFRGSQSLIICLLNKMQKL